MLPDHQNATFPRSCAFSGCRVAGTPINDPMLGNLRSAFVWTASALAFTVIVTELSACTASTSHVTPPARNVKIGHVVILFQENRSFNNLFAGFPGADTAMSAPCATAFPNGHQVAWCKPGMKVALQPISLATGEQGFGKDIQHNHGAFELEYSGGKMDGFDLIAFGTASSGQCYKNNDCAELYPYAYVRRSETKPYWDLAKTYALGDHMFSTATTDSYVAHQQIVAGTTKINRYESIVDTPDNFPWGCDSPPGTVTSLINTSGRVLSQQGPFPCFTYRSMADLLDAAGISWKYYVYATDTTASDGDWSGQVWNGFASIEKVRCARFAHQSCFGFGSDWKSHISEPSLKVLDDIQSGTLPQVSWVIPGLLCSDHPASGAKAGPSWVSEVVNAIGKSKYWTDTAIVILWDDWGGFYDNVAPPQINYTSLGMRVPVIVVSPYAKRGYVSHTQYDFGSVLKFIEDTFGAGSLNASDATASSIGDTLNLTQRPAPFTPVAAPNPHPLCKSNFSSQQIIEHDGGIPE